MCNLINTHTHKSSSGDGNEDRGGDGDGNGDVIEVGIAEGGGKEMTRKNPHNSCIRDVRNGRDLGGNKKSRRHKRVGSVAVNLDHHGYWVSY